MENLKSTGMVLFIINRLSDSTVKCRDRVCAFITELRGISSVGEALQSGKAWFSLLLLAYSLLLLFVGIRYKKTSLFPFTFAVLFGFISPIRESINTFAKWLFNSIPYSGWPAVVKDAAEDPAVPALVVCALAAIVLLSIFRCYQYVTIAILVFELKKLVLPHLTLDFSAGGFIFLLLMMGGIVAFILLKKMFNAIENTLLMLIFITQGAILLLTMVHVITGYPAGFLDFTIDIFSIDSWREQMFKVNFGVWLVLCLLGLRAQVSMKALLK